MLHNFGNEISRKSVMEESKITMKNEYNCDSKNKKLKFFKIVYITEAKKEYICVSKGNFNCTETPILRERLFIW